MSNPEPFDFVQAIEAARRAAVAQKAGEQAVREAAADLADKERIYRVALAREIVQQHADGAAWTVAQDLARGNPKVADLRYERDVAKGVLEAAQSRVWRHTADRKDTLEFISWSRRVAPDGQYEETPAGRSERLAARRKEIGDRRREAA